MPGVAGSGAGVDSGGVLFLSLFSSFESLPLSPPVLSMTQLKKILSQQLVTK